MIFAVVVFPGSNCHEDVIRALHVLGMKAEYIWHGEKTSLREFDAIFLPGGFSYGDYLRPGAIAALSPIMEEVYKRAREGALIMGICNGFQILLEMGLLPGALLPNQSLRFVCKPAYLRVERKDTVFTSAFTEGQVLSMPVAHADGNYYLNPEDLKRLEARNGVVLRYSSKEGSILEEANPNGSVHNIAGIINEQGNVFGLMPHPERAVEAILESSAEDGRGFFQSIVKNLEGRIAHGT